jgi:hypothetical protein
MITLSKIVQFLSIFNKHERRTNLNSKDYGRQCCVDEDFYHNPIGKKTKKRNVRNGSVSRNI